MRALGIDNGFHTGYGVLGSDVRSASGTLKLKGSSVYMGVACRHLYGITKDLIEEYRPDVVAFAIPFIGRLVTPVQLRPIMGLPCIVEMVCSKAGVRCVEWSEGEARKAFLGKGQLPGKSDAIKAAVQQECRNRGWPFPDGHAADALCIADYTLVNLDETWAHRGTALFQSSL